ncbi:hypothetical protein Cni_G00367 [Canna indica]|uniref:Uncharacterized protein n=1 Tax=Canna indica TaxID=4628 RepID=A0AAQ3JMK9_9LILI|nr:hypothetical protein Cni_G00367 [Canna indica]
MGWTGCLLNHGPGTRESRVLMHSLVPSLGAPDRGGRDVEKRRWGGSVEAADFGDEVYIGVN